ncbi:MAG: hypothetical protein JWM06_3321, partial [Actinomycetia bacterium]|nr:hypothetical protein [Actinomycetes bacterium]
MRSLNLALTTAVAALVLAAPTFAVT